MKLITFFSFVLVVIITGLARGQEGADSIKFKHFRIGSYGEIIYQHMDYGADRFSNINGAPADNRSLIGIPRMILAFDYWFTPGLTFSTEIEFEHGGTGNAMEIEYDEMGEYEMETEHGGEVVLEQFHITKTITKAFNIRIGHMVVPLGNTNARHLPIQFFGTIRPEGENELIPTTWHETGISILGKWRKWYYEFQLVNGLDANGFSSANWIKGGHQGVFEGAKITSPAFTGRIENSTIPDLRLGISGYYGNSCKNTSEPEKMKGLKGTVKIVTAEAEYNNHKLIARCNFLWGFLNDSYKISAINKNLSSNSQFTRTPIASQALTWSIETGFNILAFIAKKETLYPFIRYEYYNSMQKTEDGMLADSRFNRQVWTLGFNYYLLPNLAMKMDYSMRNLDHGNYNMENTLGIALVYTAWFFEK